MMESVYNEKMTDKASKPAAVTVTEVNTEWDTSTDTLSSPRTEHLQPKCANLQPKRTWQNVLIIAAFVVAYGVMVVVAVVPELMGSFPFMPASYLNDYTTFVPPCTPFGMPQGRFEVNLSWGGLTFFQAKAIDAMWNLTVGRGLQALFAWASVELFNVALLRIVQDNPISLSLYTKLAFSTTSVSVLPHLFSSIWHIKGWRCKAILVWLVISIAHLLSFPALLDLSTGYITSMDAMLKLADGTYDPISNGTYLENLIIYDCRNPHNSSQSCAITSLSDEDACSILKPICTQTTNLLLGNHTVPIADVAEIQSSPDDLKSGFVYGQWLYQSSDHPERRLKCEPGSAYSWGFSTGYLWIVSTLTSLWTLGMMVLWIDSLRFGVLWRTGRHVGDYRHVLDIAHVLQEKLGPNTCMYSNPELAREVKKLGPVGFHVETDVRNKGHIGLAEEPNGCTHSQLAGVEFGCKTRLRTKAPTWPLPDNFPTEAVADRNSVLRPTTWDSSHVFRLSRPTSVVSQTSTVMSRYPSLYRASTFDDRSNRQGV